MTKSKLVIRHASGKEYKPEPFQEADPFDTAIEYLKPAVKLFSEEPDIEKCYDDLAHYIFQTLHPGKDPPLYDYNDGEAISLKISGLMREAKENYFAFDALLKVCEKIHHSQLDKSRDDTPSIPLQLHNFMADYLGGRIQRPKNGKGRYFKSLHKVCIIGDAVDWLLSHHSNLSATRNEATEKLSACDYVHLACEKLDIDVSLDSTISYWKKYKERYLDSNPDESSRLQLFRYHQTNRFILEVMNSDIEPPYFLLLL